MIKNVSFSVGLLALGFMAGCAMSSAPEAPLSDAIVGQWRVEYIADRGVVDRSPARLQFNEDGKLNGNASCNRFFANYQLAAGQLTVDSIGSTKMLCHQALNEQETRFLTALPGVHNVSIEHGILSLTNAAGEQVLRMARVDSAEQ